VVGDGDEIHPLFFELGKECRRIRVTVRRDLLAEKTIQAAVRCDENERGDRLSPTEVIRRRWGFSSRKRVAAPATRDK
jgi:hypothetical protein